MLSGALAARGEPGSKGREPGRLIMIPAHEEADRALIDLVDDPMFFGDSADPTSFERSRLQRFGFANSVNRIFKDGTDQGANFGGNGWIGLVPGRLLIEELGLENRFKLWHDFRSTFGRGILPGSY